jgi:hypothetical protein
MRGTTIRIRHTVEKMGFEGRLECGEGFCLLSLR